MNFNDLIYLIIMCWSGLVLLLFYIIFKRRDSQVFEQALSIYGESSKNLALLLEEQSEHMNKNITDLIHQLDKLSEDYDEPDKTLH